MRSWKTRGTSRGRPAETKTYRFEKYTLHEEEPSRGSLPVRWKVSGRNSNGSYRRIRFDANGLGEAQKRAEKILFDTRDDIPELTLAEAFAKVIPTRRVKAATKAHYRQFAGYFCAFIEKNFGVVHWRRLRFEHIDAYLDDMIKRGLSGKTVGHYLEPVRFTAAWISRCWPERYANFCLGLRVPANIGHSYQFDDQKRAAYLRIAEVCDYLDWLEAHHDYAEVIRPGVALQGLCGLQLQEALRLHTKHVDLAAGTITIEGEVKNRWRVRRLPIPQYVVEILREAMTTAPKGDSRIVRYTGNHWKAYSSLVVGSLDKWAGGKRPIAPKDLRNTLPNGGDQRWLGRLLRQPLPGPLAADDGRTSLSW